LLFNAQCRDVEQLADLERGWATFVEWARTLDYDTVFTADLREQCEKDTAAFYAFDGWLRGSGLDHWMADATIDNEPEKAETIRQFDGHHVTLQKWRDLLSARAGEKAPGADVQKPEQSKGLLDSIGETIGKATTFVVVAGVAFLAISAMRR